MPTRREYLDNIACRQDENRMVVLSNLLIGLLRHVSSSDQNAELTKPEARNEWA
jgi:hypothetical protein